MSTEPDDDLDITAELPQLDMQAAELRYAADGTDSTDYFLALMPADAKSVTAAIGSTVPRKNRTAGDMPRTDTTDSWPVDELIGVRDKIVDLEAALLDAELKTAKLDKQYQELQTTHATLVARETEVTRDRDRLDAERALLIESRQQLREQFDQHQAQTADSIVALQNQLQQLQQQLAEQQIEQARRYQQHQLELASHHERTEHLSAELVNAQARARELDAGLQAAQQQKSQQEISAAALARNLTHEMFEREALNATLLLREQRIAALEVTGQALQKQLDAAEVRRIAALADIEQLQGSVQSHLQQNAELQTTLRQTEQRAGRLTEQLDAEQSRNRTAEQDKERLTRLAAAEHETYESTRKELADRLTELNAVQEQLGHARAEIAGLNKQIAGRGIQLHERDEALAAKQQALQLANDDQTASRQREAALTDNLAILQEELLQAQSALQARMQSHQSLELQLGNERIVKQQVQLQLNSLHEEMQTSQAERQRRDQFILDQASELDEAQRSVAELQAQLQHALDLQEQQQQRIATLESEHIPLQAEYAQQAQLLAQAREELDAKHAEEGATAKQVEDLQLELRQHVEALNAIRRDIHQVAQQSRYHEAETQVRTLVRIDDESVTHLLNKPAMVIGRANDAEICIRSNSISRRHACLRVGKDVVIVEDLGSTNGCYVNGKRIKRQLLKDGDRLEVGDMKFRFAARAAKS